jgi:ABC-type branched-subunit amino acid transport system ATPase component
LDEPAAGLDPSESAVFGSTIRDLAISTGIGVLLIDHDTRLIFEVCDQVVVLDFGKVVASGTVEEVRSDPLVIEAYLGVAP